MRATRVEQQSRDLTPFCSAPGSEFLAARLWVNRSMAAVTY